MTSAIEADDETTWPTRMLEILSDASEQITKYHVARARLDQAARTDVMLRINPPKNEFRPAWESALQVLNGAIAGKTLLGFHATRLTDEEREDVISAGLRTLSLSLFERRIRRAYQLGHLPDSLISALRARNQVNEKSRAGKIWFCFSKALLTSESGVRRLFVSWGGEALYNSHERDRDTGPVLASLGRPRIVVAAVPIDEIRTFMTVGERLLNVWCARRGINTGHSPDFEGYVCMDVVAGSVIRILDRSDQEFIDLTECESWSAKLV